MTSLGGREHICSACCALCYSPGASGVPVLLVMGGQGLRNKGCTGISEGQELQRDAQGPGKQLSPWIVPSFKMPHPVDLCAQP